MKFLTGLWLLFCRGYAGPSFFFEKLRLRGLATVSRRNEIHCTLFEGLGVGLSEVILDLDVRAVESILWHIPRPKGRNEYDVWPIIRTNGGPLSILRPGEPLLFP